MFTNFLQRKGFWLFVAASLVISLILRQQPVTPDVSWLITMCERILAGETAYIDIFETTPPVPMLLYMPGALIAMLLPVSTETASYFTVYIAYFISLTLTARILPAFITDEISSRWLIITPAIFFLFVLSYDAFAQRETIAAAFALPITAVFVRSMAGQGWGSTPLRIGAIILGALSIAIKPPLFALPGIVLGIYAISETRSLRPLYSSGLALAGILGVSLTAISLAIYPAYLGDMTTLMRDIYVPVREPLAVALGKPAIVAAMGMLMACALLLSGSKKAKPAIIFALVALSYFLIIPVQGKYFGYHAAPTCLFGLIALSLAIANRLTEKQEPRRNRYQSMAIFGTASAWLAAQTFLGLDDRIQPIEDLSWSASLEQPTALAITPYIGVGFPLARDIDAVWIDRIHSQWAMNYARLNMQRTDLSDDERELSAGYFNRERNRVRALIQEDRPEIIIQSVYSGTEWLNVAMLEGAEHLLDDYEIVSEDPIYRIWQRTPLPTNLSASAN